MKNFFYSTQISQTMGELMAEYLPPEVKRIYQGDFTVLPQPEKLDTCLPAVIIENMEASHSYANNSRNIIYSQYKYRIFYVYPYDYTKVEKQSNEASKIIEQIANIMLFSNSFSITIEPSDTEVGGVILKTEVLQTSLSPVDNEIFSLADVPVAIGAVDIVVHFRTYEGDSIDENDII